MTTASARPERTMPSPTARSYRWLVGRAARIVAVAVPLALVAVLGAVPVLFAATGIAMPSSLWSIVVPALPNGVTFAFAAMAMSHLAPQLAFGITRRGFAVAVALCILTLAAVFAPLVSLGYVLEAALFRAYGWTHLAPEAMWSALLGATLRTAVWGFAGALTAAVWYRFGPFVGVTALPITAVFPAVSSNMWTERAATMALTDTAMLLGLAALLGLAYVVVVVRTAVKPKTG